MKVKVDNMQGESVFSRFYTCFKACKDAFVVCCPFIGLDDCFLKGKYGGELLIAVARNANDQILSLAYAIVEVENKETWKWFLEILVDDLGGIEVCGACTFMSNQQKVFMFCSLYYFSSYSAFITICTTDLPCIIFLCK